MLNINFSSTSRKVAELLRGKSHDWIENYLSGCRRYVFYDGSASNIVPSKIGVPQGSILGPLLFLLYINDLPNVSSFVTSILYADGTNIFWLGNSLEDISSRLNSELELIYSWLQSNKLSLNTSKASYMAMTSPHKNMILIGYEVQHN